MSEQHSPGRLDRVAQKWRGLAERRRAHFVELFESGRWRHYYSEEQFLFRLREAIQQSERWAMIAPPPPTKAAAVLKQAAASGGGPAIVVGETAAPADDQARDIPQRSAA